MVIVRLARLIWRELRSFVADPRLMAVLLLTPFLYTVLLGSIYSYKRVTHIPTWVIDQDRSALSRAIRDAVANNEIFRVVREDGSLEEFTDATRRGTAFACIWIPEHFERDVKHGRPVRLLTVIDGSNMIIANSVTKGAAEVGGTYSVGVLMKRLAMRGTPSADALSAAIPIESATRVWYNPTYNYMNFMLPGLIATILQQITLLGVALAFAREREQGQLGEVLRISKSPLELLLAKGLVYTLLNLVVALASFAVGVRCFDIPIIGSVSLLVTLLTIFITALVAMGLCVSVLARDQLFATQILMLIAVPSFLISGFTWPQMAMKPAVLAISNALPLTHFVLPMRQVMYQGAGFGIIRPHLLWLWLLAAISYGLAYLAVWRSLAVAARQMPTEGVAVS